MSNSERAFCLKCDCRRDEHVNDKCLWGPTSFDPYRCHQCTGLLVAAPDTVIDYFDYMVHIPPDKTVFMHNRCYAGYMKTEARKQRLIELQEFEARQQALVDAYELRRKQGYRTDGSEK